MATSAKPRKKQNISAKRKAVNKKLTKLIKPAPLNGGEPVVDENMTSEAATLQELHNADRGCRMMIAQSAKIAPMLLDKRILANLDIKLLNQQVGILTNDIGTFSVRLGELSDQLPTYIKFDDAEGLRSALSLAEKYLEWQEEYQLCVLPIVQSISDLVSEATKRIEAKKNESVDSDDTTDESKDVDSVNEIESIVADLNTSVKSSS